MENSHYAPGVCNIGETEIQQREKIGWIGLAVTIALWIALDLSHASPWWKLALFLPASMGATGLIQGFSHFCAGFGMKGVFNFGQKLNVTDTVQQAEWCAVDKKKARQIFAYSLLAGAVIVAIAAFL